MELAEAKGIVQALSNLDLSTRPEKEIREQIKRLSFYPIWVTEFHIGKTIFRARNNEEDDIPTFKAKSNKVYSFFMEQAESGGRAFA